MASKTVCPCAQFRRFSSFPCANHLQKRTEGRTISLRLPGQSWTNENALVGTLENSSPITQLRPTTSLVEVPVTLRWTSSVNQPINTCSAFFSHFSMDIMAIPQQEPPVVKHETNNRKRRTKQRSLTKLLKAFGGHASFDDSGRTEPTSSEFFSAGNGNAPLRSCMKQKNDTAAPDAPKTEKKSVSFDTIEVREHQVVLGDNPSVSSGPPLSIAWESHATHIVSVDDYESVRPTRRSREQMLVPRSTREEWLRNAGFARSEFVEMERSVQRTKRQRAASAQTSFISSLFTKTAILAK